MSNRQTTADLFEAFGAGRYESPVNGEAKPLIDMFDNESVWVEPCGNARSGTFRGVKEIIEHTAQCMQMTDGTLGTDVVEILRGDNYVVILERALALRNGLLLNMVCTTVFEVTGGIVKEMRVLPFDPEAWNKFWS